MWLIFAVDLSEAFPPATAIEGATSVKISRDRIVWDANDETDIETILRTRDSRDGHPGFRCLGGQDLPPHGTTLFVFDGCDPGDGEETPNDFVVPFATALTVAKDFLRDRQLPSSVEWYEL